MLQNKKKLCHWYDRSKNISPRVSELKVMFEIEMVSFKFAIMLNSISICCEGKSPPSNAIQVPGLNPGFRSRRYSSTFEPSVTYMDDTSLQASRLVLFKVLSILEQ